MEMINLLTQTRQDTLKFFDLPEHDLSKKYGEDKWTIREILNHLADAETVLYDRIKRVISEPKGVIWAFDQDLWCKNLDYKNMPLHINRDIYGSTRNAIIYLAEHHYHNSEKKEFIHSETGLRTLKDEFEKVAWHNKNHLTQIENALKLNLPS